MPISRELAVQILKYLSQNGDSYFPFLVMYKENDREDDAFVGIEPHEWIMVMGEKKYQNFQLRETLQPLHGGSVTLMSKSLIAKSTKRSLEAHIIKLARNYKQMWQEKLWQCEQAEAYRRNEFLGGQIKAYENCLRILNEQSN